MIPQEFYDQRKWLDIHRHAENLIATKNGVIIAAVYNSPMAKTRQDCESFIEMLRNWASTIEIEE